MNSPEERILTDVFVIGSGIAGGVVALILAENPQVQVTVVTNAPHPWESNTFTRAWASLRYRATNRPPT